MTVERLAIDRASGKLRWHHDGVQVSVAVEDIADAAVEPATGRVLALVRNGAGRLLLFGPSGEPAGSIEAPAGYSLSHLIAGEEGLTVVGQGDTPRDGWPDWHFLIDARAACLRRTGPAY